MKKSIFNNKIFSFIMVFALVFALIIPSTAYADNYKKGQNVVIDKTIRFNSRATGTVVVTMLAENMTIYGEQIYYEFENANSVKAPVLNYLNDKRFTASELYINSFFMNKKGRKMFTKEIINNIIKNT